MTDAHALDRRSFLKMSTLAALAPSNILVAGAGSRFWTDRADHTVHIVRASVELAPGKVVTTTTYGGCSPGNLLRLQQGRQVIIDIYNDTDRDDCINWHGQRVLEEVTHRQVQCRDHGLEGPRREGDWLPAGSIWVPKRAVRRIRLTPTHAGVNFYRSDLSAGSDLRVGLYGGQIGPVLVKPRLDAGGYDREFVLVLKELEPYLRRARTGYEVAYRLQSVNGRMLGHGEPLQVRAGERVQFHVLNASATHIRRLALPGHEIRVLALDGRSVPSPAGVQALHLAPGERVTALVDMNQPGVWMLGDLSDNDRRDGMGIIVEYAGANGEPRWSPPAPRNWNYRRFGCGTTPPPDGVRNIVITKLAAARSGFNQWMVNGVPFSLHHSGPVLRVARGGRYRLRVHNTSEDQVVIQLRGHSVELAGVAGEVTAGVVKDVISIASQQLVELDFQAQTPGANWLYGVRQLHRDFGLMARIDCV